MPKLKAAKGLEVTCLASGSGAHEDDHLLYSLWQRLSLLPSQLDACGKRHMIGQKVLGRTSESRALFSLLVPQPTVWPDLPTPAPMTSIPQGSEPQNFCLVRSSLYLSCKHSWYQWLKEGWLATHSQTKATRILSRCSPITSGMRSSHA